MADSVFAKVEVSALRHLLMGSTNQNAFLNAFVTFRQNYLSSTGFVELLRRKTKPSNYFVCGCEWFLTRDEKIWIETSIDEFLWHSVEQLC